MKNVKKVLCLVLTLVMVFSITCTTAFADDSGDNHEMPERLIGTTIEVSVAPGDDADIMPLIWDQTFPTVGTGITRTGSFIVPDRYFAYEAYALDIATGGAVEGNCRIDLYKNDGSWDDMSISINGKTHKADWVDLEENNSTCYFKLKNTSGDFISVVITYYSWK